jgi:phage gp29-like protein
MQLIDRIINAVRGKSRPPRTGQIISRRREDFQRDYPSNGLTPDHLIAIFRDADNGSPAAQMELFEQMEEKDAHLYSVAQTRRLAVTGLPWEIVSAAELPGWSTHRTRDSKLADAAAQFCQDVLRSLDRFEESLTHLALAAGRGVSVAELIWEASSTGVRLSGLIPVEHTRLVVDDLGNLRILTSDSPNDGIPLPPNKFVVHAPQAISGHPMRGGLLRVTAMAYIAKRFAIKDWLIFAEVFGMPVRVARYAPNATPEEKREILEMLRQLGADATAVFSKAVDIEIKQSRSPGETNLYENLCLYFDREVSKAWLGQTLTTDTTRMLASSGAAKVHDHVRRDLRDDDLRKEANTLRRDLLTPLTRLQFGPDVPVPHFRRVLEQRFDSKSLTEVLDSMVNDLGARVPKRWAHAALGIPEAATDEPILPGRAETGASAGPQGG